MGGAATSPPRHEEPPWVKYFLIGVCVTAVDLVLYPYLKVVLVPYLHWGGLALFLALGAAAGYLLAWNRRSGYVLLVPTGAVLGIVVGYELSLRDPTLMVALIVGVAASGLSIVIGSMLA